MLKLNETTIAKKLKYQPNYFVQQYISTLATCRLFLKSASVYVPPRKKERPAYLWWESRLECPSKKKLQKSLLSSKNTTLTIGKVWYEEKIVPIRSYIGCTTIAAFDLFNL